MGQFNPFLGGTSGGGGGGGTGTDNYQDLSNKPKINDVTLVGNKSLSDIGAQSALSSSNKLSANFIEETNDKKFNTQANWTQVNTSAPDFIKNKPVLGTAAAAQTTDFATAAQGTKADSAIQGIKINNATVTPDANKVINITVPTTASDVDALPDTTKYAASLSLSINSSTFVVTGQLKDQDGNNLGTAQTIDLPLESVVVNGSYNSQTKKVVLTLQNGNTIEFSVADLVAGLQTELSSSNKLNPAYINYDSTHRAVTDTEKSTWNNAATTVATNQAALTELVNEGAKNICNPSLNSQTLNKINFIVNSDGTILADSDNTATTALVSATVVTLTGVSGTYVLSGCAVGGTENTYRLDIVDDTGGSPTVVGIDTGDSVQVMLESAKTYRIRIRVTSGQTISNLLFKPMLCTKADWDISQEYVPYALPNPELTAATIEMVDNGVKNLLKITESSGTSSGVTFTVNADGTITTSGTVSGTSAVYTVSSITLKKGTYRFSNEGGEVQNQRDAYIQVNNGGTWDTVARDYESQTFTIASDSLIRVRVRVYSGYESGTFKPMLCSKAAYDISHEYVPFALPNPELTAATIEVVDNGPKNLLNHTTYTRTVNGVTYTVNADRSITITSDGTNTQSVLNLTENFSGFSSGNYVLSGCTDGSSTTYDLRILVGSITYYNYNGETEFYYNGTDVCKAQIVVRASKTVSITMKPMLCTKDDWNVSQTYQPYRPSYQILSNTNDYITGTGSKLAEGADLNNYNYACKMYSPNGAASATLVNTPWTTSGFQLITIQFVTSASFYQFLIPNTTTGKWYRRKYTSETWSDWIEYDATPYLINGATAIASNTDLNNLKTPGVYVCTSGTIAGTLTNCPYKSSGFRCDIIQTSDTNCIKQIIQPNQMHVSGGNARYERTSVLSSSTWSSWYKFEGTAMT